MEKNFQLTSPIEIILNKKFRWLFHLLFLIVVFSEDIITAVRYDDDKKMANLIITGIMIFCIYFNIYFLYNKFLISGKILKYIIYSGLCIITYAFVNYFTYYSSYIVDYYDLTLQKNTKTIEFVESTTLIIYYSFTMLCIIGTALSIKLLKNYYIEQKNIQDLKRNNLENELLYLKNQINPHFLFNSLNNIYTLSKKNHENSSEAILLLSELLRYQLYDCSKEKITLDDEIEYIKRFIKLEELRKKSRLINFIINGNTNGILIAPFLFMPFIENAIKFGNLAEDTSIYIEFSNLPTEIKFLISNNISNISSPKSFGGIGIKNVKRRLDLIYPNMHELIIDQSKNKYQVTLTLKNGKN